MYSMMWGGFPVKGIEMACILLTGMILISCSSSPVPEPDSSKDQIQQDADRFFDKMKKEETQSPYLE